MVEEDAARHFDVDAKDLFSDERPTGFWLDRDFAADRGISAEELSRVAARRPPAPGSGELAPYNVVAGEMRAHT